MTLDLGIDPPGPFHDISEPHRLVVEEHPEDGFTILHPQSCEVEIHEYPADGGPTEQWTWTDYQCMVSWHVGGADFQGYRHAFDDPTPWNQHDDPLLPGIYRCWVEVVKYRCWDAWGGYEYDSVLHVEPQAAIDTGRWWLATCANCRPALAQPFRDRCERDRWAWAHNEGTRHRVILHSVPR